MCQTSALMDKGGKDELLLENVTALDVVDGGLRISTLFEGTSTLAGAAIRRIDFVGGKLYLYQKTAA